LAGKRPGFSTDHLALACKAQSSNVPRGQRITAILERADDGFFALSPALDIASRGATIEEARANFGQALNLSFETGSSQEIRHRPDREIFLTRAEVPVG
jgi:predicted RNase H-like HicB family nuclease